MCTVADKQRRSDFAIHGSSTSPVLEMLKRPAVIHQRFQRRPLLSNSQTGISVPFCNMFSCGCTPPPNRICCNDYKYDFATRKCRLLL
ncbi:hypothetical protein AVEN_204880-1 [Araneus ventricosus]|uniref:Uncharacterized protein n=1 Tax=Araneus ventricosus TaxID=182803 RepID=A0A4Y2TB98_ARAVE|nr:hypothetical protein AVEN_204880-1 [Araneus ventricosus]